MIDTKYIIENADLIWYSVRWCGGNPKCECGFEEIYRLKDGRYKCKHCGKIFSDTSNTMLHYTKIEKWKWLIAIYKLVTYKHVSISELQSDIYVNKSTAWKMLHKIRMYMSFSGIDFSNIVKMDECHIGGWTNMHLKKKIGYMKKNGYMPINGSRYTKEAIYAASSNKKQHILSMVNESGKCQLWHINGQIDRYIIKQFVEHYNIKHIISDESNIYQRIKGIELEQCNHSKNIYTTKQGHSSNACENRFSWTKRIFDLYTHSKDKYLQLYLNQIAYKINIGNLTFEQRFYTLLNDCMNGYMKLSDYSPNQWITYKQDKHIQEQNYNNEIINSINSLGLNKIINVKDKYGNYLN